jgi:hypothetical protein
VYVFLRRLLIRILLPVWWRVSRRRPADALAEFAATEADSGWQFLYVMDQVESPKDRALIFHNMLEESEHTTLFDDLVRKLRGGVSVMDSAPRNSMVEEQGGLAEFLAYVYAGELDISHEFEAYANATQIEEASALFRHIQEEEEGHHYNLRSVLVAAAGSDARADKLVKQARRRRMWMAWLRFWKRFGERFMGLWLALLYFAFGPFMVLGSRRRLRKGKTKN